MIVNTSGQNIRRKEGYLIYYMGNHYIYRQILSKAKKEKTLYYIQKIHYRQIHIYTKSNNIEKSGQRIKEERAFIIYIYKIHYRKNTYIYKKDVLYFYIGNQSWAKIKKKRVYIPIEKNIIYIREYRHNLGKIQERKGVHIVYISKYLWAKTKKKEECLCYI